MSKIDPMLTKMREICLSLPDTKETLTWGQPHFRVGDEIFRGYGRKKAKRSSVSSWRWITLTPCWTTPDSGGRPT